MQSDHWLPLTEYALRSGMSISTLRRKIKSNSIEYKMEEGRYLIRFGELGEGAVAGFASSDVAVPQEVLSKPPLALPVADVDRMQEELQCLRDELRENKDEGSLRWRALEARVAGIARKLDQFSEQMAELKMLVKIFEEKLDGRV
jgi:hypothetical protein